MELKRDLPPLLVRADADAARGTGHVMRSLALAQGWVARGGAVRFLTTCPNPALRRRIQASGAALIELDAYHPDPEDGRATIAAIEEILRATRELPWVALDGYHFDTAYQKTLRAAGCRLLVIDDNAHLPFYDADVVLNHGIHAVKLAYASPLATKLLLGTAYALLRPEFRQRPAPARAVAPLARKILVTLGGSDPADATSKVIEALRQIDMTELQARIVVGPMNPRLRALRRLAAQSRHTIAVESGVQSLAPLMRWADLAVTAAGGTCWELACLGVPTANVVVAENQEQIAAELAAAGVSVNLGWHDEIAPSDIAAALSALITAPERRAQMSADGKAIVDGRGVERVIDALAKRNCLRAA